ncbi:conserved Plasmodium protein, unknown function [Plasmodium sp. DRC-Itaito]|nr:conserved Plasmodium protein, unknown function [Plasmodium sp. DRC-Itaito]SOV23046.1 conserved Plasmodium protein, unknown function [Plasmodium sp. DRC-Itaito]
MSEIKLKLESNFNKEGEQQKDDTIKSNETYEEENEEFSNIVNKYSDFYKNLYAFIESKSCYINLIYNCKREEETQVETNKKYKTTYSNYEQSSKVEKKTPEESSFNKIKEIVKEKFPKSSDQKIELYLKEIINEAPQENCSLHKILFVRNEQNIFIKHNLISYLFNFIDCKTLLKLKGCSKIDSEVVSMYYRKILYTLSFKDDNIKTNIHYWNNVINYFFYRCANLKPINRMNYPTVLKNLEQNKNFCVITPESMDSCIYISSDYFKENLITSCTHKKPLPHTCNVKNEISGIKTLKTQQIELNEFIQEYYKRLTINDDEIMWNVCYFRKSKEFLTILLLEFLKSMLTVLNKYNGKCIFKKTEYLVNCGHHITHRIWIQMFYEYGFESVDADKKKNIKNDSITQQEDGNNRTLYLTIADHYKWDA